MRNIKCDDMGSWTNQGRKNFKKGILTNHYDTYRQSYQFLKELIDINCNFSSLGSNELFLYCVSMNDENIINPTAKYIYEILKTSDTCF